MKPAFATLSPRLAFPASAGRRKARSIWCWKQGADAGREKGPPGTDEILARPDGRFGFRVVHPTTGDRKPVFDYEAVREAEREEERAERLRLYYVAMTRAKERLIVSGAVDPAGAAERETPIGWVLRRLEAEAEVVRAGDEPIELERGQARLLVRVER